MKTDKQLQEAVEQELLWEPSVESEHIGVSVKNGVVQLDGRVNGYAEKCAAERAAMRLGDVKAVASEIKVELPASDVRTDADIAGAAVNVLIWNLLIPETVKVQVEKGWLKLEGTVEWQYQKEEAERALRGLKGVKEVQNDIIVSPKINAFSVKSKIEDAFKRNAEIDAEHFEVDAMGSSVSLRGIVRSLAERNEAERVAWAAPGVTNVRDLITVN